MGTLWKFWTFDQIFFVRFSQEFLISLAIANPNHHPPGTVLGWYMHLEHLSIRAPKINYAQNEFFGDRLMPGNWSSVWRNKKKRKKHILLCRILIIEQWLQQGGNVQESFCRRSFTLVFLSRFLNLPSGRIYSETNLLSSMYVFPAVLVVDITSDVNECITFYYGKLTVW